MELFITASILGGIFWLIVNSTKTVLQLGLFIIWAFMIAGALYSVVKLLLALWYSAFA